MSRSDNINAAVCICAALAGRRRRGQQQGGATTKRSPSLRMLEGSGSLNSRPPCHTRTGPTAAGASHSDRRVYRAYLQRWRPVLFCVWDALEQWRCPYAWTGAGPGAQLTDATEVEVLTRIAGL